MYIYIEYALLLQNCAIHGVMFLEVFFSAVSCWGEQVFGCTWWIRFGRAFDFGQCQADSEKMF